MKALTRAAVPLLLLVPAAALAAGPQALSLKTGVPAELLSTTLGIARGLFPLSLVLALVLEAFGGSPSQSKNYGGVVWRALVVVALLASYPKVFGTVVNTTEAIAARIAPQEVWDRFALHMERTLRALEEREQSRPQGDASSELLHLSDFVASYIGGSLFDSLVMLFVMLGQAFQWVFGQLSRILIALFYVIGPLALVFHIPGPAKTAGSWFSAFITIASWPVLSSVLLAIATALMYRTHDDALAGQLSSSFGAVISALLIIVLNLAVPLLASAIVGGGIRNVAASSLAGAALGAMMSARLGAAGLKGMMGRSAGASAGSAASGPSGTPLAQGAGSAPTAAPAMSAADIQGHVPPSDPTPASTATAYPEGSIPAPLPGVHDVTGTYASPTASVHPAAPHAPAVRPREFPTQPGHPFDKRMDNGWGDVSHLQPLGHKELAPADPHKLLTQSPDNGLIPVPPVLTYDTTKS
jgi:hypothetical protein